MKRAFILIALLLVATRMMAEPLSAYAQDEPAAKSESSSEGGKDSKKASDDGEAKKKTTGNDVSGGKFNGDPIYIHIPPLILPVITANGVEQLVTIMIDVEVRDFDVADQIHSNMPRIMDALNRALYGGLGEGNLRDGKLVNVTKIKAKASAALSEVIGVDAVQDVLIQGVAQRML